MFYPLPEFLEPKLLEPESPLGALFRWPESPLGVLTFEEDSERGAEFTLGFSALCELELARESALEFELELAIELSLELVLEFTLVLSLELALVLELVLEFELVLVLALEFEPLLLSNSYRFV